MLRCTWTSVDGLVKNRSIVFALRIVLQCYARQVFLETEALFSDATAPLAGLTTGRGAPDRGNRARVLAAEEKNGEVAPAPDRRIVSPAPGAGFPRHGHRIAER